MRFTRTKTKNQRVRRVSKIAALARAVDIRERLAQAGGQFGHTPVGAALDLGSLVVAALLEIAEAVRELKPGTSDQTLVRSTLARARKDGPW